MFLFTVYFDMNNGKTFSRVMKSESEEALSKELDTLLSSGNQFTDFFPLKEKQFSTCSLRIENISSVSFEKIDVLPIISFEKLLELDPIFLSDFFEKFDDYTAVFITLNHRNLDNFKHFFAKDKFEFMNTLKKSELKYVSSELIKKNEIKILSFFEKLYLKKELAIVLENCYSIS